LREDRFGHDHGGGDGFVGFTAGAGDEGAGPVVGADLADGALRRFVSGSLERETVL
jgi:hypothetical protein